MKILQIRFKNLNSLYGEWHIDHKKPVSLFDKNTDASIVNELNNLQPLWKLENLSKGNRYNK